MIACGFGAPWLRDEALFHSARGARSARDHAGTNRYAASVCERFSLPEEQALEERCQWGRSSSTLTGFGFVQHLVAFCEHFAASFQLGQRMRRAKWDIMWPPRAHSGEVEQHSRGKTHSSPCKLAARGSSVPVRSQRCRAKGTNRVV
jgi:hypothetical protein